jgi:NAD(P)-dependent dehydrogenase (short-subunit alcohol dehydrogenase family)
VGRERRIVVTGSLEDRVAVITGGARGIGRVTARVLAAAGADVAVIDRLPGVESVADVEALGRRGLACAADVSDAASLDNAFDAVRAELGDPDILVNGAAITNHIAPVTRMTREGWERELAVNLTGAFAAVQAVLPAMVDAGWGRIVLVSSLAARGGLHLQAAYAASKAGVVGLAKTVALEHARDGVSCNAVLPGLIETEAVVSMPEPIREATIAVTPARRLGRMEEVAHLIGFLVSDEAGFVNGAEIPIDGGIGLTSLTLGSTREAKGALRP